MGVIITHVIAAVHWILLFLTSEGNAQGCNYYTEMATGEEYYIYNPSYPNKYTQSVSCFWNLRTVAGSSVYLSCNFDLPSSPNCNGDRLSISRTGNKLLTDARYYCGSGTISLYSEGSAISVGLYSTFNSQGGTFLCTATAIKNSNPSADQELPRYSNCDCGWKQVNRIVGGVETGVHEFPSMSGLIYKNQLLCGATIISERFVLSAAHCVLNRAANDFFLLVGDHNIASGSDTPNSALYKVNAYEIYPDYNSQTQKNDIAIIQAEKNILFSTNIGPMCLPFRYTYETFNGQSVIILGWGQVEFTGPLSDTLQKAQVNVISREQCNAMQSERITDGELCTYSDEERDSCQNDSGGPVLWFDTDTQRYQLVGIISHGVGCASAEPGINVRVSEYLKWIISRTNTSYCIK